MLNTRLNQRLTAGLTPDTSLHHKGLTTDVSTTPATAHIVLDISRHSRYSKGAEGEAGDKRATTAKGTHAGSGVTHWYA